MEDEMIKNKKIISDAFGKYFSSNPRSAIQSQFGGNTIENITHSILSCNTFYWTAVEQNDVIAAINSLKNTNSVGIDCLTTEIIKTIGMYIAEPLSHIINLSVHLGDFPKDLKIGAVTPVYKGKDSTDIQNYRPITVPPVMSKVIEKIVYNKILLFLSKYDMITKHQNGFCPGRSTESASCDFFEYVYTYIEKKRYVGALFFDLSKAFDTLNLYIMKEKLYNLGFRDNFLTWLMSYLENRQMYVKVANERSSVYDIDLGVPQGSILGPLIFLLFINDMPAYMSTECTVIFADDCSFAVNAEKPEDLEEKLNTVSLEFTNWCSKNFMIVNPNKTVFMLFHSRLKIDFPIYVNVNGNLIEKSDATKFLGTYINSDMTWKLHIDHVCKKINSGYYALLQLKNVLSLHQLMNVYYAIVYSHLSYNIILWGCATNVNRIFISQKRIIRLIFNLKPSETCRPYFLQNDIMTFYSIYIYHCVLYVRKNISKFSKNCDNHDYFTRHGDLLQIPKHTSKLYEKNPIYMGIKFYNNLPIVIKNENNVNTFKRKLRMFLVEGCFYNLDEYMSR